MGRKRGKISKQQAGVFVFVFVFDKGYTTIDQMFTLIAIVKKKVESRRGGKVYVAFIEYKKSFDT